MTAARFVWAWGCGSERRRDDRSGADDDVVILSEAKDLFDATVSQRSSFAVFAAQDDGYAAMRF
jgi:hypothetical protein